MNHINLRSPVSNLPAALHIGRFTIQTQPTIIWNPRPTWKTLHAKHQAIFQQVKGLHHIESSVSNLEFSKSLSAALAIADLASAIVAAKKLAGLGPGLTPSGDDFIIGSIYAAWIIHPHQVAEELVLELANTTSPLTTSLSAAWLKAAGNGEAGILWHRLFDALISGERSAVERQISNIRSIGATSGADALAGFISTLISYEELERKHVIPKFL